MNVGIVGLGLIGGSAAKAYTDGGASVYGYDIDKSITDFATLCGAAKGALNNENIGGCELILLAVPPVAAAQWLTDNAQFISKDSFVIDFCGTKRVICETGFRLSAKYAFTYIGGHPMAGTHYSGFRSSKTELFRGAPMVIVPPRFDDIELLEKIKKLLEPLGFGSYSVTTAERHDELIAFTSQLAHIVSNAYIKSPSAVGHDGFSAGSYRDLTRVAQLNPEMWAELFLENGDFLVKEIDTLINNLGEYRQAVAENDCETLQRLLHEGSERKKEVDDGDNDKGKPVKKL